jgi:hypothetical protein
MIVIATAEPKNQTLAVPSLNHPLLRHRSHSQSIVIIHSPSPPLLLMSTSSPKLREGGDYFNPFELDSPSELLTELGQRVDSILESGGVASAKNYRKLWKAACLSGHATAMVTVLLAKYMLLESNDSTITFTDLLQRTGRGEHVKLTRTSAPSGPSSPSFSNSSNNNNSNSSNSNSNTVALDSDIPTGMRKGNGYKKKRESTVCVLIFLFLSFSLSAASYSAQAVKDSLLTTIVYMCLFFEMEDVPYYKAAVATWNQLATGRKGYAEEVNNKIRSFPLSLSP